MEVGPLVIGAIVLGVGLTAVLFVAGYLSSGGSSTLTVLPGGSGPDADCATLCTTWNRWRSTACTAIAVSAAAATALAAANAALAGAAITAASLLASAVAASFIPFIGPAIAAGLFAAYATAQAVVVFLLGRQVAAAQAAGAASGDVTRTLNGTATARADLMAPCTDPAALSRCLATPSPCPGVP
jgi:hypothetical protein